MRAALKPFFGRNLLELSLSEVANTAQRDPWVKEASVKRILPGTLRVSVKERTPGALAVLHGLVFVVDDGGFVMGPAGPGLSFDLPLLTGLDALRGEGPGAALAGAWNFYRASGRGSPRGRRGSRSSTSRSRPGRRHPSRGRPEAAARPRPRRPQLGDYLRLRSMIERRVGPAATVDLRWNRRISILPTGNATLTESD